MNFAPTTKAGSMPGMTAGGTYDPERAAAELMAAHLPEDCYAVECDALPGSSATQFRPGGAGIQRVRSARLTMSLDQLRDALQQVDAHLAERAAERAAAAEAEAAYLKAHTAELEGGLAALRDLLPSLQHDTFAPVREAFKAAERAVLARVVELRSRKPVRGAGGSLNALRVLLAAEAGRLEAERDAEDARLIAALARRGFAAA